MGVDIDIMTGDIQVILVSFYSHMDAQVYYLSNFFTKVSRYMQFLVISSLSSPELCFNILATASSPQFI